MRAQDVGEVMNNAALIARIGNALDKPFRNAKLSLRLRQLRHHRM